MIQIYGASDDLIEIEGDITDEVGHYGEKSISFSCSDGTKGTIAYSPDDSGNWKITVKERGEKFVKLIEAVGDDAEHTEPGAIGASSYSDVLIVDIIDWIKIGRKTYKG